MEAGVHAISAFIINSSPNKFGRGGSPRFAAAVINHHDVDKGISSFNPRFRVRVRVPVRSYDRLAKQNRAEEISPWAIMRISLPCSPQVVWDSIPAATNLI